MSSLSFKDQLVRGITSKYNGDFYCLTCLHSFRTENKLKSHKKITNKKLRKNRIFMEL